MQKRGNLKKKMVYIFVLKIIFYGKSASLCEMC